MARQPETTERLYYTDSYLRRFQARVIEAAADNTRIYLDRTAFYPTSGGQPFDLGAINGIPVREIEDEGERIAHILAAPLPAADAADAEIDWPRRRDHMQQHTGQHLLSAVFADLYNAQTVSFHLGAESCSIDLAIPSLTPGQIQNAERQANAVATENRPVAVTFEENPQGLRKPSDREGTLRIVTIHDLDRSACGGTHVRATGEIGPILLRRIEKMRGNTRVEFLCGARAIARARADYEALSAVARSFSAPLDDTPALVADLRAKAEDADKARRKLALDAAIQRGRSLYTQGPPKQVRRVPAIDDETRAEAQGFTENPKAILLIAAANPPSVLLAASKDSGFNAGAWLKPVLTEEGGRGGGSPTMAQGSVPTPEALESVLARFGAE